jgi:hypothetical protein
MDETGSAAAITNYWGLYETLGTGAKNYLKNALLIGTPALVGSELLRIAGGSAATAGATDILAGGGSVSTGADSYFAGVRVGLGGGAVLTNTCVGNGAMAATATGTLNVVVGYQSLTALTTGTSNTVVGYRACYNAHTAANNCTAIGTNAMLSNNGSNNTAVGFQSLYGNVAGIGNTAIGVRSARYQSGGTTDLTAIENSVFVGYNTKGTQSATNEIAVGYAAEGKGSNTAVWGNTSITAHFFNGNMLIGGAAAVGTSGAGVVGIGNGTAPSTSPADMVQVYAGDYVAGESSLIIRAETGELTSIGAFVRQKGCFAGIHVHDASTAQTIATGATYTKSTAFTDNDPSANCTSDAANDKIVLTKTGYYRVWGSISFTSGTNNVVVKATAFLNGTEQDQVHCERKIATGSDIGNMTFVGIIDNTTANWDLDLRLAHDAVADVDITIKYANLSVEYIGET